MTQPWSVAVASDKSAVLSSLRLEPELFVLEVDGNTWLRGSDLEDALRVRLLSLPGIQLFQILIDEQLVPFGKTIPVARLPKGDWAPIRDWRRLELGPAALSGVAAPASLKVVAGGEVRPSNVMLLGLLPWCEYAETAPQVRLQCWRFAVDHRKRVLVAGFPLPPLPGKLFCEEYGVAIEAGCVLSPRIDSDVVACMFPLNDNGLALFSATGEVEVIPGENFVRASRSAIRNTRRAHAI